MSSLPAVALIEPSGAAIAARELLSILSRAVESVVSTA